MKEAKQVLALEKYDPQLDSSVLTNNLKRLSSYLKKQEPPFSLELLSPTISFILETPELLDTQNAEQQQLICESFIYAFNLTVPDFPFDKRLVTKLPEFYHLLAQAIPEMEEEQLQDLLTIANDIDFFVLPKDLSVSELFTALYEADAPASLISLKSLIEGSDRIPSRVLQELFDARNDEKAASLIKSLGTMKQNEIISSVRAIVPSENVIEVAAKISEILDVAPQQLYQSIRGDLGSTNETQRKEAVNLFVKSLIHQKLSKQTEEYFIDVLNRSKDRLDDIREQVARFCFNVLTNIKELKAPEYRTDNIVKIIWDKVQSLIEDTSLNVRLAVFKGLVKMKWNDIRIDEKDLAKRINDKSPEIRMKALKILLSVYEKEPDDFAWLEDTVLRTYPVFKIEPLTAFSVFMEHKSLIDVLERMKDRKPLLLLLKDTYTFRKIAPQYDEPDRKALISQFVPVSDIRKAVSAQKNFLEAALDPRIRQRVSKKVKTRLGKESAALLMGMYQPDPLDCGDVLAQQNTEIAKEIAAIFADEFEDSIDEMLARLNDVDLTVLSQMKNVGFGKDTRTKIIKQISTVLDGENRPLALKAISMIYNRNVDRKYVTSIKFKKNEYLEQLKFYARIGDADIVPSAFVQRVGSSAEDMDEKEAKWALKLFSCFEPDDCIEFHLKLVDKFPALCFQSYLANSDRCAQANNPDVFLKFSSLIQAFDPDVRLQCIRALNRALDEPKTAIQFLSYFALSATDPVKENARAAEEFLKKHILRRREILKELKKSKQLSDAALAAINPMGALPYLIYILAHHPDFDEDEAGLPNFAMYLRFFMKPLCAGVTNFDEIQEILIQMKCADDKDEEFTPNMVKLCDVAVSIIMEIGGGRVWEQPSQAVKIHLPVRYFTQCTDKDRIKRDIIQSNLDIIKSPAKPKKILNAGMSPARQNRIKRTSRHVQKDSEDEQSEEEEEQEIKETPKRSPRTKKSNAKEEKKSDAKTPKRSPRTKKQSTKDDDEEPEETPKRSPRTKKQSTKDEEETPKRSPRTKKSSTKDEDEEPEETPKRSTRTKKSSTKDEEEVEETPKRSPRTKKSSTKEPEETPKKTTRTKKQSTKDEEEPEETPKKTTRAKKQSTKEPEEIEETPKKSSRTKKSSTKEPEETPKKTTRTNKKEEKAEEAPRRSPRAKKSDAKEENKTDTKVAKRSPKPSPKATKKSNTKTTKK